MFNPFKSKPKILTGIKISAVRGKEEIILFRMAKPEGMGIEIPQGFDVVCEVLYDEDYDKY